MIILFGPAGSGKSTQGEILAGKYGWRWLSNGQVIRDSRKYDDIINRGELIPDQDVIDMMNTEIAKAHTAGQDVILDGYPRDVTQARYLLDHFSDKSFTAVSPSAAVAMTKISPPSTIVSPFLNKIFVQSLICSPSITSLWSTLTAPALQRKSPSGYKKLFKIF